MGRLTTHILDTSEGRPAAGVRIELFVIGEGRAPSKLAEAATNSDGRTDKPILEGDAFQPGVYELHFHAGVHLARARPQAVAPPFLDIVVIRFGVASADEHYHVPLLLQAHGYATYRGS